MKGNLTIVFSKKSNFVKNDLINLLIGLGFTSEKSSDHTVYKDNSIGISINDYQNTIVVQGTESRESRAVVAKLANWDSLVMKGKNFKKYLEIFSPENGKIICPECGKTSNYVHGVVDDAQNISFQGDCGHEISTTSPIIISRGRILPDMNRLISKSTSRLINSGFFLGFEIVIPEYYEKYVDACFNPNGKRRRAFIEELGKLKELEGEGKIKLYSFPFYDKLKECNQEEQIEDEVIIDIGQKTQSLIISGDSTVIQKLKIRGLEGILTDGKIDRALKINGGY